MTARSTTTATNELSGLDRARRSLGCRQRPFILTVLLEQFSGIWLSATGAPAVVVRVGGSVLEFLVESDVLDGGYPGLLLAGYLPNRGGSVTRRELRCPVK
jgi:hypothetical protein